MHTRETGAARPEVGFTATTDANMTVTNQTTQAFNVLVSNNTHMDGTFPNQQIESGKTSPSSHVSASVFPSQSHFDIAYNGEKMTVKIGQGTWVTNVSFSSNDGKAGAVLAPTQPFSTGVDYTFRFFGGPGVLPPYVNTFIANNVQAAVDYVKAHPQTFDLGHDAKITVNQLDLKPNDVTCSYAAVTPEQSTGSTRYAITAILNASGGVYGNLAWKGVNNNVSVKFDGVSVLVQATLDISASGDITCTVTELACSMHSCTIDSVLLTLIAALFPVLYSVITTPYHFAGAINTMFNATIIAKLNAAIAKILHPTDAGGGSVHRTDYRTWMSTDAIQRRTLSQLKLPGTQHSGTYGLTPTLSQMPYGYIELLWRLRGGVAPSNGSWPLGKDSEVYVGDDLLNLMLQSVLPVSIAQDQSIRQQLDGGVRYLDLRIYRDTDGSFYTHHGLRGPTLNDLLGQIRSFLDAHPKSGELILVEISHTNFAQRQGAPHAAADLIRATLGDYLYLPAGAKGTVGFDLQELKDLQLWEITGDAPKVIVLNTDDDYHYDDAVVNTRGFADSGRPPGGVDTVDDLVRLEGEALNANTDRLYKVAWTLTPQTSSIVQNVAHRLSGNPQPMLLAEYAAKANAALPGFLATHGTAFTVVTVDRYEMSAGRSPVEVIVGTN